MSEKIIYGLIPAKLRKAEEQIILAHDARRRRVPEGVPITVDTCDSLIGKAPFLVVAQRGGMVYGVVAHDSNLIRVCRARISTSSISATGIGAAGLLFRAILTARDVLLRRALRK
jgi:hypothetical protein